MRISNLIVLEASQTIERIPSKYSAQRTQSPSFTTYHIHGNNLFSLFFALKHIRCRFGNRFTLAICPTRVCFIDFVLVLLVQLQ